MKLTLQLKLLPSKEQALALLETMRRFNAAATFAARIGYEAGKFSKPSIQKLAYRECREKFGLSAQMAVRAVAKAAECFSRDKTVCPIFRENGAMTYDERILSFKDCHRVSILAVGAGRLMVPYVFGQYQAANLARIRGQCDLVHRGGMFFLYCTIEFAEPPPVEVEDFLGVDLGIVNLATDSTGEQFSGGKVERNRKRRATARKQYQRKGTRRARRRLKKMSGKQGRFQHHTNHEISKRLVEKAKAQSIGIALEDLRGIRTRVEDTVSKRFRRRFGNWGFYDLRRKIAYKAQRAGVPVIFIDPRNTSRTCSECGYCHKRNRKSQERFVCEHCGHSSNADLNAACNIARLGRFSKPAPKVATASVSGKAAGL